jgi:hypothetical protein
VGSGNDSDAVEIVKSLPLEVTETRLVVRPALKPDSILTGIRLLLPAEFKRATFERQV